MPTYTIHAPPPKIGAAAGNPERFVFVRDGFHFWAFALGPLWLLLHRLWLAFACYIFGYALVGVGLALLRASINMQILVGFLIAVLIGLEAPSIWRWTLTRRGWSTVGFLVAENAEMAEQRFFAQWVQRTANTSAVTLASEYTLPTRRGPPSGSDVIGLFPEPGGQR
ncbi:MAG TPA: DUF2628 domain-containing protein [Pseudolabrys sp.]|jgi:hypothetical protein|nr:DUF2628 domain-containing protein [Pseudolabrys sp.]